MRLDKSSFRKQSFKAASDHKLIYSEMSGKELGEAFRLMMEAAYGFVGKPWPKMEKQIFAKRKLKHD